MSMFPPNKKSFAVLTIPMPSPHYGIVNGVGSFD